MMAEAVKEKEKLERKSSKSRLAKQDEVEELEEDNDNSPSSEASDATVIPAGKWLLYFSQVLKVRSFKKNTIWLGNKFQKFQVKSVSVSHLLALCECT